MKMCLDGGVDVRAANDAGDTVLHAAATRGSDVIIQFLADKGADVRAKNRQGRTPLDAALARRGASAVPAAVALLQKLTGDGTGRSSVRREPSVVAAVTQA